MTTVTVPLYEHLFTAVPSIHIGAGFDASESSQIVSFIPTEKNAEASDEKESALRTANFVGYPVPLEFYALVPFSIHISYCFWLNERTAYRAS